MRDFIKDNHLSFGEGRRNSTVVILIGYAQHLGLSKGALEEVLENEVSEDSFIGSEIDRLWPYCLSKRYEKYWKTKDAKLKYKF